MVRFILTTVFFAVGFYALAENENKYKIDVPYGDGEIIRSTDGFTHPGLILGRASLSVGKLTGLDAGTVYIEGNAECFLDRLVSVRGDFYYFSAHTGGYKPFTMNHSLFTGTMFHYSTKGDFDPYVGLEVGVNMSKATDPYLGGIGSEIVPVEPVSKAFSPVLSPVIGFNYYGGKFFHLSIHARYILGTFMDNYNVASLNEWRISFGLGFNISKKLLQRDNSYAGIK